MGIGVSGLLSTTKIIDSSGSILATNIGVFSDQACTQPISSLDWGVPAPGSNVNRIIYLKNTGNVDVTLSMDVSDWNPVGASNYLTISWDQENTVITSNEVIETTISLSVDSGISAITDFSCQITIEGTG
jgi:hypothetical protein